MKISFYLKGKEHDLHLMTPLLKICLTNGRRPILCNFFNVQRNRLLILENLFCVVFFTNIYDKLSLWVCEVSALISLIYPNPA